MKDEAHAGTAQECQLCPICALLRALGGTQPDVVGHLSVAARELALALQATLDAHLDGHESSTDDAARTERLERIRID